MCGATCGKGWSRSACASTISARADNLLLSGNVVRFTHRGRRYRSMSRTRSATSTLAEQGDTLTLRHSSELSFRVALGGAAARPDQLCVHFRRPIDAVRRRGGAGGRSGCRCRRCRDLTIAHDHLSHGLNDVRYDTVAVAVAGAEPPSLMAGEPGQHRIAAAGAPYYSMAQAEIAGFALAIHTAPRQPERLTELEVHVAAARQAAPGARAATAFRGRAAAHASSIGEDKLLDGRRVLFAHRRLRRADARCGGRETDPARRARLQRFLRLRRRDQRLREMLRGRRGGADRAGEPARSPTELRALFDQYIGVLFRVLRAPGTTRARTRSCRASWPL